MVGKNSKNIFDIKADSVETQFKTIKTKPNPRIKSKYSKEQIKKMLSAYTLVPSNMVRFIPRNTHIRYFRTNGKFVRGGFVVGYTNSGDSRVIVVANGLNAMKKGYVQWSCPLSLIKSIYKKPRSNAPDQVLLDPPSIINEPLDCQKMEEWVNGITKTMNSILVRLDTLEKKVSLMS